MEIYLNNARAFNIFHSPKQHGSCENDSEKYLSELGITIVDEKQPIQFNVNNKLPVHGWSSYVQGFSSSFVQSILDKYKSDWKEPVVFDPFSGSGTVQVQAKLDGYVSYGTELNPLLAFISNVKLNSWNIPSQLLLTTFKSLATDKICEPPEYLKSENHFDPSSLNELMHLKGGIAALDEGIVKDLIRLAFSSILIDSSYLKRSPCLGYSASKRRTVTSPFQLMKKKVIQIADDLDILQAFYSDRINLSSKVFLENAAIHRGKRKYDLVITSPPYMNGLDYVMNYKIEMGWMDFVQSQRDLKSIKDEMVVCDNVSRSMTETFIPEYTNEWIEDIKHQIYRNIERRGNYRRKDMPNIVHKYFDDMYKIFVNIKENLSENGRFVLVVGDSLIADVYLPTDLLLAKMGKDMGMNLEKIAKARNRRSGQIRSYKLRETIISFKNG